MTKSITLNGAPHRSAAATIADLVRELELSPEKVAVERNGEIVPRSTLGDATLDTYVDEGMFTALRVVREICDTPSVHTIAKTMRKKIPKVSVGKSIGQRGAILAAGGGDGIEDGRADMRAARRHGIVQRLGQPARTADLRPRDHGGIRLFKPGGDRHGSP